MCLQVVSKVSGGSHFAACGASLLLLDSHATHSHGRVFLAFVIVGCSSFPLIRHLHVLIVPRSTHVMLLPLAILALPLDRVEPLKVFASRFPFRNSRLHSCLHHNVYASARFQPQGGIALPFA